MKRISKILSIVIALMLTFALVACEKDPNKDDPSKPDTGLTDNLVLDENGQPLFEEEVTVKMWSVIGDPDQVVFAKLVQQFNNEMMGQIKIDVSYQGHFDYYSALDSTWQSDRGNFPDVCFMHNEKTIEYAAKGYFWALDDIFEKTNVALDFSLVYPDINRVTMYKGERYGVPVDAHGFLTQFRQDIIKKNGLGFDNNTRFIPESRAEYQQLLTALRAKADAGELWTRNINKGMDHSWVKANKDTFYPSFSQSTDPDGLSALYANGGTLVNEAGDKVNFQNNKGFETYITDQVNRYNAREVGTSGTNTEMFGNGNAVMFSEGPWWIAQTYSLQWNSAEMKQAANGISAEDAADPIINTPMTSSRPLNWWTLDEYIGTESGSKWFGNGHVICLS
ncbi:MAG: extracellular solute-binding protein, partial [Clostridia bacterium]|nr:extracellular solute-binding protein [Clostridia bacterium]